MTFASLGAGMVSAEQNDEQTVNLEDLGILELSVSEEGVIEALMVKEAFFAFMNTDEADLPAIESVAMCVSLGEDGELVISNIDIDLGENQPDEVAITLRLSDELVDLLHTQDISLVDLVAQLSGSNDGDSLDADSEDYDEYEGSRIHWADEAYQLRGSQLDYDRVMEADDPAMEFYAIYDELMQDWEDESESDEDSNESADQDVEEEESNDEEGPEVEDDSGDELDEEYHEAPGEENDRDDSDALDEVLDSREDEITQIVVIVNTDGEIADVTVIVIYEDGDYDMYVFTMLLEDLRARLANFDGIVVWNWMPSPPDVDERCVRGTLRGIFTVGDDGGGTVRGLVMNAEGDVIANMWGTFDADGNVDGMAAVNGTRVAEWAGGYANGHFRAQWRTIGTDVDPMHGILKGHYKLNDTGTGGVYQGKWKVQDCYDDIDDASDDLDDMDRPDIGETGPRHSPIRVDAERIDDVRQLDKAPAADKKLMDKLGDVMDKPLVEDENGGSIVDIGEAAAGSTLGTIALLGAGFIRRRVTGGI